MPSLALPFVQPGDKIYWLLDSGSSYHVVSKQTLETGHVKILSKRKMPKTVCQTATGDLVEVGSDTHATIEVNFLTTRPLEKHGDVLSTFACTCRLEAIVSDQIRHNLINLNLLCWKGWKPTLYEGLLTAEQKGITLYPHLYGDCTWLESVESTCDPLLSTTLTEAEWRMVAGLMPRFFPPYLVPEGEWSTMLPLDHTQREWQKYCHVCGKGATPGHLATDVHNKGISNWKRQGCPQLVITPDKFTDNQRLEMVLQAYLPNFTVEQVRVVKERVLQEEWYRSSNRDKYEGPIPSASEEEEVMVVSSSAAPSGSAAPALMKAGGIWTEPPPPPPDHWKDQWKTLAGHLWCSSSVVGPVAQCEASGPVDTPKHLTTPGGEQLRFRRPVGSLEGSGGSPPGCIRESAAKDSTKGFGSVGVESKGFGSYGTPYFGATSTATTPGISTIASTDGGPWSSLRLDCSDLPERRGDLLLPVGGELFYPGTDGSGRGTGTATLGRGSSANSRCLTQRPATSSIPQPPAAPKMTAQGAAEPEMTPQGAAEAAAAPVVSSVIPGFGAILPPPPVPKMASGPPP
ncbi:hypothetical protein AK812_SmicGene42225 [Symbiodinium microadriaticum]|uniref:Uncharacterized protein n=1 Tax=Symbiodinium microadriaticum TaxID=2951 RepID=A0A1Q9C441_SYMMI|nr:hypothetical protein AK812_SmicGene42225 [Symbiodinium microadriaticum]